MKVVGLAFIGFFFGAILGGVIGVICGLIWTQVFHTSSFEGYDGMLVFYSFLPIGILGGGSLGAAALAYLASRDAATPNSTQ
jgi:ABC-type antimicrobial peptide transport system permease subunit